jgi:endonuclease YncB( thermonuclease family)
MSCCSSKEIIPSISNTNLSENIEWKDTKLFVPPIEEGIVIKVYDGDTITIAAKLPYPESELYRFQVRLNGIDAPEMKTHNEDEKMAARISQKILENLILHKRVKLKNRQTEKYGRILADIYLDDKCINQIMIDRRYAISYNGGTKTIPVSWLKYQIGEEIL